jgi:hypothetical protein
MLGIFVESSQWLFAASENKHFQPTQTKKKQNQRPNSVQVNRTLLFIILDNQQNPIFKE